MIKSLIRNYLISLASILIFQQYVGGFTLSGGLKEILIISAVLTFLHFIVKFLLDTVLGSLNFLTLGFAGIILDAVILFILASYFHLLILSPWVFPGAVIQGFVVPSFQFNQFTTAILCAVILDTLRSVVNVLV